MSATRETPRHMKASDCGHFCDPVAVGLRPGERPTFCSEECLARSVASLETENARNKFGEKRLAAIGSSALASIVTEKLVHGD